MITNRNRRTGQASYSTDFDRVCRCGHPFAVHTWEAPHTCVNEDFYNPSGKATGEPCDCEKFRPVRLVKPAKRADSAGK